MNIAQALRLAKIEPQTRVAFVGAGGKSTAIFQLAKLISGDDKKPVIVTATTHLHVDQVKLADLHLIATQPSDVEKLVENLRGVMLITGAVDGDRTIGLDPITLTALHTLCLALGLPMLIEADGSRRHPLKAPAQHEPPIPQFATAVVVCAGLTGMGHPLTEEFVHRPEIFARLSGLEMGQAIGRESILRVLTHKDGGLKNIPQESRKIALLNQADTAALQSIGGILAGELLGTFDSVLVASLENSRVQTFENIAGIVLAGGGSKRFGQIKQLLDFHGKPFVRAVCETAVDGGLSPIVMVSGADAGPVEAAVEGLHVRIARNEDWESGQSSSIQTGLRALADESEADASLHWRTGAAVFLLADQPQVSPTVIHALVERHTQELSQIIAPQVAGQRANPVLFDRSTFPDLMTLTGDVGGRKLFSIHRVEYLPWHDESLLLDVDTPDDLKRLEE